MEYIKKVLAQKKLIIILIGIVVLGILFSIIFDESRVQKTKTQQTKSTDTLKSIFNFNDKYSNKFHGQKYEFIQDRNLIYKDEDSTYVLGPKNTIYEINGVFYDSYDLGITNSMDGIKSSFLIDYYDYSTGGVLWYISDNGQKAVAEDVAFYIMSDNGEAIIYLTVSDYDKGSADLWHYDCNLEKSELIVEDKISIDLSISPDGKTFGYCELCPENNLQFESYICEIGKEPKKFSSNGLIIAISNNGEYIYYIDIIDHDNDDASVCVRTEDKDVKLFSVNEIEEGIESILFNRDYSQILYSYDGKTYISRNGEDREKLCNDNVYRLILPKDVQSIIHKEQDEIPEFAVYGIDSFEGMIIDIDEGIMYINEDYKPIKFLGYDFLISPDELVEYTNMDFPIIDIFRSNFLDSLIKLCKDGKTLVYVDYLKNLYLSNNIDDLDFENHKIGNNLGILDLAVSNDGSIIYYVNDSYELWYMKNNMEPKKISDSVDLNYLCIGPDDNTIFFVSYSSPTDGGVLFSSTNGNKPEKLEDADIPFKLFSTPSKIVYYTVNENNSIDVYISYDGKIFEKIIKDLPMF